MRVRAGEARQHEAACHCRSIGLWSFAFASVAENFWHIWPMEVARFTERPMTSSGGVVADELAPSRDTYSLWKNDDREGE